MDTPLVGPRESPFHKEVLASGLRVVSEFIPGVESVTLGLWIAAGSSEEPPARAGITHFLEHMFFKGTERRSAAQLAQAIEGVGGYLNAFTDSEYTCLHARVLADHLPLAADVLCDMLTCSLFDRQELEREKQVVLQEIAQHEDIPEELVHELYLRAVWAGHPLGRPTLGSADTVRSITRDDLLAYWRRTYTADRIIIAAAGRLDHAQLVDLTMQPLARLLASSSGQNGPPPTFQPGETIAAREAEQVHLCLGVPGCAFADEDRYALGLLDTALGGGASSRLFQHIREERGLAYQIGSFLGAYRQAGLLTVSAGTSANNFRLVADLVRAELAGLTHHGLSAEELGRVKEQVKGGMALALESTSYRMNRLALGELYLGRPISFAEVAAKLDAVRAEDVLRVARERFVPGGDCLVTLGPVSTAARV